MLRWIRAYGLFSARITDPRDRAVGDFAGHVRTSPFLRELMQTFLHVGGRRGTADGPGIDFDELGVSEVVDLLDDADMEAVVRDFGDRNPEEDPVIHFYEHFLAAYDKQQKVSRGVFYTPRPVVAYIVGSIDDVLRSEFGLSDGLADITSWGEMAGRHSGITVPADVSADEPFVMVLDPATGTGTFLVEVIDSIHRTMIRKWETQGRSQSEIESLWNDYVPAHLLPRLHGYELLMAPYAIAHLKIGLKLLETGYKFESHQRALVFLTNALEPAQDFSGRMEFAIPALAHEAVGVNEVKSRRRFTVVVGNPPYSSVSRNMNDYIGSLVGEYMLLPDGPLQEKSNRNHLQDDYVKFLRLGQDCIQRAGIGVIGMITNSSFLAGPWYRGMRYQLLRAFQDIRVLDLHGGKGFIRSAADDDENVFDIMQSVAISLLARTAAPSRRATYGQLVGSRHDKYRRLLSSDCGSTAELAPAAGNQWLFQPIGDQGAVEWSAAMSIEDVFQEWGAGVKTNRNGLAVGFTRRDLQTQIEDFADLRIPDAEVETRYSFASNYQWDTRRVRIRFANEGFSATLVTPYLFRPFDFRFIYWHPSIVFNMRGDKMEVLRQEDAPVALLFSRTTIHDTYSNFFVTRLIADHDCLEKTKVASLWLEERDIDDHPNLGFKTAKRLNLTAGFQAAMQAATGIEHIDPSDCMSYAYGLFHSRAYRSSYAEFLRIDFPRVLMAGSCGLFKGLARIGRDLIALHLMESTRLGELVSAYVGPDNPEVGRIGWSDGTIWLDAARTKKGQATQPGSIGFSGISEDVWRFQIGGHQVCEKWLRDRQGRTLEPDDITHYQKVVVAISETIRLMTEIDEVIEAHGGWPGAFVTS